MNRQLTGWLAWGALAVVISVPSAEIVFSRGDQSHAVIDVTDARGPTEMRRSIRALNPRSTVDFFESPVVNTAASANHDLSLANPAEITVLPDPRKVVVGPQPVIVAQLSPVASAPAGAKDKAIDPFEQPIPIELRLVGEQPKLMAQTVIPETTSSWDAEAVEARASAVRIVGDPRMSLAIKPADGDVADTATTVAPEEKETPVVPETVAPAVEVAEQEVPVAPIVDEIPVVEISNLDTDDDGIDHSFLSQDVAAGAPVMLVETPLQIAPVPMPASSRPDPIDRTVVASVAPAVPDDSMVLEPEAVHSVPFHGRKQRLDEITFEEIAQNSGDGFVDLSEGGRSTKLCVHLITKTNCWFASFYLLASPYICSM
jgi:hypothetical protein